MKKNLQPITVMVLFFFVLTILSQVSRANGSDPAYKTELGTCRKAKTKSEENNAPHLYFEIDEAKELWKELATLRLQKKRISLIDATLKLKDENISLWQTRFKAAEELVVENKKVEISLRLEITEKGKKIDALTKEKMDLTLEVAKYKGEKYQMLVWGFIGGAVLMLLVAGGVGIYFAVGTK